MVGNNSNGASSRSENLRRALFILKETDGYGNLSYGLAVFAFACSGGIGVLAFFWMVDLAAWLNLTEFMSLTLIAAGWIMLFVVWVLAFLFTVLVFEALGFKNVRVIASAGLTRLTLSLDELRELRRQLAAPTWKHRRVFERVVDRLVQERTHP